MCLSEHVCRVARLFNFSSLFFGSVGGDLRLELGGEDGEHLVGEGCGWRIFLDGVRFFSGGHRGSGSLVFLGIVGLDGILIRPCHALTCLRQHLVRNCLVLGKLFLRGEVRGYLSLEIVGEDGGNFFGLLFRAHKIFGAIGDIGAHHGDTGFLVLIRVVGAHLRLVGPGHSRLGISDRSVSESLLKGLLGCPLLGFFFSLDSLLPCYFPGSQHLLLELVGECRGYCLCKVLRWHIFLDGVGLFCSCHGAGCIGVLLRIIRLEIHIVCPCHARFCVGDRSLSGGLVFFKLLEASLFSCLGLFLHKVVRQANVVGHFVGFEQGVVVKHFFIEGLGLVEVFGSGGEVDVVF